MSNIIKEGVRVLTPAEFDAIQNVIKKQDFKIILNVALYTGMRYVELQRFQQHKEWLKADRRCIYLPREASRKKRRTLRDRYVYLTPQGLSFVQLFFKVRKMPSIQHWNIRLKQWAEKAGIGTEGISAKTTRKTWESWLAVSYPDKLDLIAMNQGHTNLTALRHYLQLPFTDEEKAEIKNRTAGWMGGVNGI